MFLGSDGKGLLQFCQGIETVGTENVEGVLIIFTSSLFPEGPCVKDGESTGGENT